jgi:hypothetical protein
MPGSGGANPKSQHWSWKFCLHSRVRTSEFACGIPIPSDSFTSSVVGVLGHPKFQRFWMARAASLLRWHGQCLRRGTWRLVWFGLSAVTPILSQPWISNIYIYFSLLRGKKLESIPASSQISLPSHWGCCQDIQKSKYVPHPARWAASVDMSKYVPTWCWTILIHTHTHIYIMYI